MNEPANLDDKYEIVREIKQGGFGIVYFGYDRHLDKPIAVKEISPSLVSDPKYIDMFQAEARNIAKLSHHNIVHVYDLKRSDDGRFYIIMEYIDGLDLEKILKTCRSRKISLPHRLGAYLVSELCLALDYAHTRRDASTNEPLSLVHQDVSPSNIMVSKTGEVKLIDFGIASVRQHLREDGEDASRPGKMPYMSPEMFEPGAQLDRRSDIYSLGLVLYESLTGQRFNSEQKDLEELASGNRRLRARELRGYSIPSALERVLEKSLENDRQRRYQTANQMYIDLLQFLITSTNTGGLSEELGDFVRSLSDTPEPGETARVPETPPTPLPERPPERAAEGSPQRPSAEKMVPAAPTRFEYQEAEPAVDLEEADHFPFEEDLLSMADEVPRRLPPFPIEKDEAEAPVEEGEDDVKTVIDIVRLSARGRKREILIGASLLLLLAVAFAGADAAFRWTRMGTALYDFLYPPAIRVVSVPANASVYLDDRPLNGSTPTDIDEISPGVHKIRLEAAGFDAIERSIQVARKGEVTVEGEELGKHNTYVFRFNTYLSLESRPRGAEVRLNQVALNQRTPCRVVWAAGVPVSIEMYRAGFEPLTGMTLNTPEDGAEVGDSRGWSVEGNDSASVFLVSGTFHKRLRIRSVPPGAAIYVDDSSQSQGVTGGDSEILLPAGDHSIALNKAGFLPSKMEIGVSETSPGEYTAVLRRRVRVYAQDATDPLNHDIGAELVRLISSGSSVSRSEVTPVELTLPAYPYEAILKKEGYYQTSAKIPAQVFEVIVKMEPMRVPLQVIVTDAMDNMPIPGALLSYRDARQTSPWISTFEATDANGRLTWSTAPGDYVFRIEREGYIEQTERVSAITGRNYTLEFSLLRRQANHQQTDSANRRNRP